MGLLRGLTTALSSPGYRSRTAAHVGRYIAGCGNPTAGRSKESEGCVAMPGGPFIVARNAQLSGPLIHLNSVQYRFKAL